MYHAPNPVNLQIDLIPKITFYLFDGLGLKPESLKQFNYHD